MTTTHQNTPTPEQLSASRRLGELMVAQRNQLPDLARLREQRFGLRDTLEDRPTLAYAESIDTLED